MASRRLPLAITAKKDLKPVKTKLRFKKADVRQCRLCLRVLPRGDVRLTVENDAYDFRGKIADAVGVKIEDWDKVQGVCANCLLLVDMINSFRETCRKADTIHRQRLLMMHPGKWTSEECKKTLEDCHNLVKRNRFEMDALFKCFERKESQQQSEPKVSPVKEHPVSVPVAEITERPSNVEQTNQMKDASINPVDSSDADNNDPLQQTDHTYTEQLDEEDGDTARPRRIQKNSKNYMCELCGMLLKCGYGETHYNMFHSKSRPYGCSHPGCTKSYPSKMFLNIHIKKSHRAPAKPSYECPTCHRNIKGKVQFEKHCKTHGAEVDNTDKEACKVCGKFVYKRYLKDHMFVHSGELPYSCEFCDRKYAARTNLSNHRRKQHADRLQPMES